MWELEMRDTLRQAVNPSWSAGQDFTDYVMALKRCRLCQSGISRSVQTFCKTGKRKANVELQTAWRWHQRKSHQGWWRRYRKRSCMAPADMVDGINYADGKWWLDTKPMPDTAGRGAFKNTTTGSRKRSRRDNRTLFLEYLINEIHKFRAYCARIRLCRAERHKRYRWGNHIDMAGEFATFYDYPEHQPYGPAGKHSTWRCLAKMPICRYGVERDITWRHKHGGGVPWLEFNSGHSWDSCDRRWCRWSQVPRPQVWWLPCMPRAGPRYQRVCNRRTGDQHGRPL